MKSSINWQEYQKLELISPESPQKKHKSGLAAKLNDLWQEVLGYLSTSSEPSVWTTQDALGQTQWRAYDPMTRKEACCNSEAEMRVWLEERHYQTHPFAH